MKKEAFRDKIITFDSATLQKEAKQLFIKMSGLAKEGKKYDLMRRRAAEVRGEIGIRIDTKAIYSYFGRDRISKQGRTISIDGTSLRCNAFEQIGEEQILGAYVYFIHAGDYYLENEVIMNQLLADMWGTAFVDAIRAYFQRHLQQYASLSNEFGPGFFGMDVRQMKELTKLADPAKIGMEVRNTGILLPVKSCG
ncbi:MAG: hypothetical protein ACI4WR_06695, partial [Bulleidia sp.]